MEVNEQIVLTPRGKSKNSTTVWIERKLVENVITGEKVYVAGGDHQGIVVNKEAPDDNKVTPPPQLSLEFRVYLVNAQTGNHTLEVRILHFWFRHFSQSDSEQAAIAQEFFRDLIHPKNFPRDYVGFIKKIMKLLQHGFQRIVKIELVLHQLEATELPNQISSLYDSNSEKVADLSEEKVMEVVEHYYPNPITVRDLSREYDWDENEVTDVLNRLEKKGIIRSVEHQAYTRITQDDPDIKIVKQMPTIMRSHQPTVAIITAHFTEKLAVDAMIDNRDTFVRYSTVGSDLDGTRTRFGESNVYTLGNIGKHRIVCTKLPSVGHTREAMTAAGNTTTRLLGTFQNVDHVILVGVGGGVPHFTNYSKHVRLGDVVISHAVHKSDSIYVHCDGAREISPEVFHFETKKYHPKNSVLQNVAVHMRMQTAAEGSDDIWKHLKDGLESLESESEHDFTRPSPDTDKLFMAIGERDLIEVTHPAPQDGDKNGSEGRPRLHLGMIGAGREIARSDHLRQKFSQEHGVLAFVSEYDPVIQSVIGNCRDSFIFVRGISDYKDGTNKTEWQPYAALAAASVTKAIICALDPVFP